ncbi:MAG: ferredoxin-thioredoxin reductase catalytic domain-containing protein [Candidatus ainarchaeum sp.]|nr:ferredoxin-thioredoxin reductase catalytic domain-containing protein [Candidatus ainarchaeum sp.]
MNAAEKQILDEVKAYARKNGFRINPDSKIVEAVVKGLAKNLGRYGKKICPCRVPTGKAEDDEKLVCPCAFHIEEIKKTGHCKCRLFFAK